jgi:hypothetical protein
MKTKRILAALALLAGFLLTGCHDAGRQASKSSQPKQTSSAQAAAPSGPIDTLGGGVEPAAVSRDLGAVTLTNHQETCVALGAGQSCRLTPKMIDRHNVQLTLAVESKSPKGKIHDLSITQVVTATGKPFEVAVGGFSFSLTPNVVAE